MTNETQSKPLRICKHCKLEAWEPSDLLKFLYAKGRAHERRNICKLCASTLRNAKNNNIVCNIVGPHIKVRAPFRHKCKSCGLVVKFSYAAAGLFSPSSRTKTGYKPICKKCEEKAKESNE